MKKKTAKLHWSSVSVTASTFEAGIMSALKKALSVGKREEQPNMEGNLLARRIVCIAVRETNS